MHLTFTDFRYTRLKILVWKFNGLSYPNNLDLDASNKLIEIYDQSKDGFFVVDCKGISTVTDHAWDNFFKRITEKKIAVVFLNDQSLKHEVSIRKREFCIGFQFQESQDYSVISDGAFSFEEGVIKEIKEKITKMINGYVSDCFSFYDKDHVKQQKVLSSTPIMCNGEFNALEIIEDVEKFLWISICLADKVETIKKIGVLNMETKILTVSLRASPFAAAVAMLLNYKLETIDHFGPINKPYEFELIDNNIPTEYIYVGDFTVGGTEIRISKMYANCKGSVLNNAVVIGSLFNKDRFNDFHLEYLVSLEDVRGDVEFTLFN